MKNFIAVFIQNDDLSWNAYVPNTHLFIKDAETFHLARDYCYIMLDEEYGKCNFKIIAENIHYFYSKVKYE